MQDKTKIKQSNFIVKMVEGWCEFKIKLIETLAKARIKIDNVNYSKYKNEADCIEMRAHMQELKIQTTATKKIRKRARIYSLLAGIGTFASVMLTVCGITGCTGIIDLLSNVQNLTYILMIFFTQYVVYYVGKDTTLLKNKFYINYNYFVALKVGITFTSVTCNFIFLVRFMKPNGILDYVFLLILACSLDLISLALSAMANDCRNLQYSYKSYDTDVSIFSMLGFIVSEKIKNRLRESYTKQLKEYKRNIIKFEKEMLVENSNQQQIETKKRFENLEENSDKDQEKRFENLEENSNKEEKNIRKLRIVSSNQREQKKTEFTEKTKNDDKKISDQKEVIVSDVPDCLDNISNSDNDIKNNNIIQEKGLKNMSEKEKTKEKGLKIQTKNEEKGLKIQTKKVITNINDRKKDDMIKRNNNAYENVIKRLEEIEVDKRVSIATLKLRLTDKEWRKIRKKLIENNLVYTKGSYTYKKDKVNIENENIG